MSLVWPVQGWRMGGSGGKGAKFDSLANENVFENALTPVGKDREDCDE